MMKGPAERIIAVTPNAEGILAAGILYREGDRIDVVGSKWLLTQLERWAKEPPPREIVILLNDVQNGDEVRRLLKKLTRMGVRLSWMGSTKYKTLCADWFKGLKIEYHLGKDVLSSTIACFPTPDNLKPIVEAFRRNDPEVFSSLTYLVTRFMMWFDDPEPIHRAIDILRECRPGTFSLRSLPKSFQQAVENFRSAEFPYLEGKSAPILELKKQIRLVGPTELSTLILGETGTGKEAVAFFLHDFSPRQGKPFTVINCAGLDEVHMRSELFGHKKGAFTDARADRPGLVELTEGGTLFLDEITEMPLPVQADLLRFFQSREFRPMGSDARRVADVRIICAGQPELLDRLRLGTFRKDLYYRISEIEIRTPALREVPEDIIRVVRHVLFRYYYRNRTQVKIDAQFGYFAQGQELLKTYSWPGNARELINLVKRRVFLNENVLAEVARRKKNPIPCGAYDSAVDRSPAVASEGGVENPPSIFSPEAESPALSGLPQHVGPGRKPRPVNTSAGADKTGSGDEGTTVNLDTAMKRLVDSLTDIIPSEAIEAAYAKAVTQRRPDLTRKELAHRLELAPNTLRRRLG